jgi:hypothetical protein
MSDLYDAAKLALSDSNGDVVAAAKLIYPNEKLALYLIQIGLTKLKAQRRATNRRAAAGREPVEVSRPGRVTGSYTFSKKNAKKWNESVAVYSDNGFMIGDKNIGVFKQADLIEQANKERSSAGGHMKMAIFYETLAAGMKRDKTVKDTYTEEQFKALLQSSGEKLAA